MVLLGVVIHFVSGGLTDVGGIVGIDSDLQNFSVGRIRGGVRLAAAAAMAPLEAAAPRHGAVKAAAWCSLPGWCRRYCRTSGATGTSARHLVLVVMDLLSSMSSTVSTHETLL